MSSFLGPRRRRREEWGLTVLRVAIGVVFMAHGAQKVFMFGHSGVEGMLAKLGVPFAPGMAWVLMAVELVGGLALVLGAFTRLAAALIAIDMLVAFSLVHVKNGFFLPMGFEYVMTLFSGLVALLLAGPGALALDEVLFGPKDRR